MKITEVTTVNFDEEVLSSDKPVLVDFFATWCGPCMRMAPIIEEIAEEHDEFKVCKVNVDDDTDLAREFEVFSIPTLIVFKNGEVAATQVGAIPKEQVLELLK